LRIEIINDRKYKWNCCQIGNCMVYFIGIIWLNDKFYTGKTACLKLFESFNFNIISKSSEQQKTFRAIMDKLSGHFSFVISSTEIVIAAVDKIRSYPIYFYKDKNAFYLSNSAYKIKKEASLSEIDEKSVLIFKMSGYCIGYDTLFKELKQIEPGRLLYLNTKSSDLFYVQYYKYWMEKTVSTNEDDLLEELCHTTKITFSKMIETLNGNPVWIPLSGGYDSRLILSMLKELKYDNITTYTYGLKGIWEIKRAQFIAEYFNNQWHYVQFEPKQTKTYFYNDDTQKYFRFADGLNSAPHLAEYYALVELGKKKLIPDNAIIINGQSGDFISGGHIPNILLEMNEGEVDINVFIQAVMDKHFSLWVNLKTEENKVLLSKKVRQSLQITHTKQISKDKFAKLFELHEWEERQSKYVVNGQRAYDWLGYDWRLPLWSDELMAFWAKVPWERKIGQRLFIKYLGKNNPGGVFRNIALPPQFEYLPLWARLLKPALSIANKFVFRDVNFYQKYLRYFMFYAPYYPQQKYGEFLKDSQWHRNPVSYWSQYMLKELNIENSFHN
jgi:asparagine synthase (glutamine-hydrolysing)